jgi:hypothetical protein
MWVVLLYSLMKEGIKMEPDIKYIFYGSDFDNMKVLQFNYVTLEKEADILCEANADDLFIVKQHITMRDSERGEFAGHIYVLIDMKEIADLISHECKFDVIGAIMNHKVVEPTTRVLSSQSSGNGFEYSLLPNAFYISVNNTTDYYTEHKKKNHLKSNVIYNFIITKEDEVRMIYDPNTYVLKLLGLLPIQNQGKQLTKEIK